MKKKKIVIIIVLLLVVLAVAGYLTVSRGEKKLSVVQEEKPAVEEAPLPTSPLSSHVWALDVPLNGKIVDYYSLEFKPGGKLVSCYKKTIIAETNYSTVSGTTLTTLSPDGGCYEGTYVESADGVDLTSPVNVALPNGNATSVKLTGVKLSGKEESSVLSFTANGKSFSYNTLPQDLTGKLWVHNGGSEGFYSMEFRPSGWVTTCFSKKPITRQNYKDIKKGAATNKAFDFSSDACYEGIYYTQSKARGTFDMEGWYGLLIPFWTKTGSKIVVVKLSSDELSFKPMGATVRSYKAAL